MNAPVDIRRPLEAQPASETAARRKYKLTIDDYTILDRAGTFSGCETELVDGDVIVMSPEWMPHMRVKDEIAYRLRRAIEEQGLALRVGTGGSVDLSTIDQPRPDVIVMRDILTDKAIPSDAVLLLVEVSSTTLAFDRDTKAPAYGRGGVAECWVVDVKAGLVHRMWSPSAEGYAREDQVRFGEPLASATIGGLVVDTSHL